MRFTEDMFEQAVIELFEKMGYTHIYAPDMERDYSSPLLDSVLMDSLVKLNKGLPLDAIQEAIAKLRDFDTGSLLQKNMQFMDYLQNGVPVKYFVSGEERNCLVYLVDYKNIENNSFYVVNQFTYIENSNNRRPDVILFINGLPLVLCELKSPSKDEVNAENAYNQIRNYMQDIPSIFNYNAICVISDLTTNKAGTITSGLDRFMEWKSKDGTETVTLADFQTFYEGMFDKARLLDIIKNFICFSAEQAKAFKILAGYHQYFAVRKAVERAKIATVTDGKGGVFWHTQGSGKSLSMVFYAHLLQDALDSPTIVVMTDRIDLDDQLYSQFSKCASFLRQTPVQAESKVHLKQLLDGREANGIIFTTMFKFEESEEPLSTRRNIVVMADEAHRGQYGMDERVVMSENEQGEVEARIVVGNARIIRDALPNATFIGFTGTPVSSKDRNTREVFGEYIDIYDMTQAVEDGATRPVYYESRVIHLKLDENTLKLIDSTYDLLEQQADSVTIEKSKKMLGQMESVLGAPTTIRSLCEDIITHYETNRANLLTGKAMIVAYSRPIAMRIYYQLMEMRPEWKEKVGVVITSGNNDPEEWKEVVGSDKRYKDEMARKFKDNNDPMKIAIVVDMWLTGFDVPSLATMYVYKPMHGYNLMQAIARVNRVFKDKEGGLVVDYVGIASALRAAMNEYTARDRAKYGDMDIAKTAYPKFQEKLQVCRDLFHGFNYNGFIKGSALQMAQAITDGANFVLDPKAATRKDLYLKEALLMKQAMSLCASMTTDKERREQAYFEAVRSTVVKLTYGGNSGKPLSLKEINAQINELLKASIQSEGVISLFDSRNVGENFSLFDPNILEEISKMKQKNIAVEILRKLLAEQVSLYKRTNLVQSQKFSEMIARIMNAYYNGLISNEKVIEEMLEAAKEMMKLHQAGEELGLTQEELAFYDALTKPAAIKDFYENEVLVEMTRELTELLRKNRTIDWQKKETARAAMRKMVKRLLKKYKYPPEQYEYAIETVISQCEMWTDNYVNQNYCRIG